MFTLMAVCVAGRYMLDRHAEDWLQVPDYNWKDDVDKLYRDATKNWPSLSQQDQERFVNEAKADRIGYFTGESNFMHLVF